MGDQFSGELEDRGLHHKLLAGDLTAPARLAERLLPWLSQRLQEIHPKLRDPHHAPTAAVDALKSYLKNPTGYRSDKLSLRRYLLMAAQRDLFNALRKETRANERDEKFLEFFVELARDASEQPTDTRRLERLAERHLTNPMDRQVFSLMLGGERATEAFARVLGLRGKPFATQRLAVKKCKDRILIKLRRAALAGSLNTDAEPCSSHLLYVWRH